MTPRASDLVRAYRAARRALWRRSPRDVLTAAHALLIIVLVEASIRRIRLERLARVLGVRIDLRPVRTLLEPLPISALPPTAQRQLRCAWKVASVWPFSEGPCLRRALVGGHLVRRLDPAVCLGLIGGDETIRAHAWVEIDGRPLEPVDGHLRFEQPRRPEAAE